MIRRFVTILCCLATGIFAVVSEKDEDRPYEFAFNIIDFQHRYEKKDTDGIITGEYGFITADGVYHETGYATDKNGDFIITRMRNRKITSLEDAREIFKDRPEAAEKLVKAVAKACSGCKIPVNQGKPAEPGKNVTTVTESTIRKKVGPILKEIMKTLPDRIKIENSARTKPETNEKATSKVSQSSDEKRVTKETRAPTKKFSEKEAGIKTTAIPNENVLEKIANDLYYRFNYTITSHDHQETGYRSGRKDGSYRAQSENGVDTRVKYLSNEFGHQPNITFTPKLNKTDEGQALKGYSFLWYWQ